ncbi:MAG: TIGR03619 family F420-dependent LLM class oxidoreductase, partial [Gaiellaceae bacterium]
MRFGLSLPHYGFSLPTGRIAFEDAAGWARRAEGLGFDSVWVSDHFFYSFARYGADPAPIASLEPLTTLAGIAAVTDRVRLGTLVLCAAFRHPALLAKAATSIDLVSGGRLDLGLGAGWLAEEFEAFGFRFGSPRERFAALEETLEVLRRLFGGEPVTYDGPTVSLREAVLEPAPYRSPAVWVGGKGGPRLLRSAARLADGWNAVWRMSPEAYAQKVSDVRAACDAAGRDPETFDLSLGLYSL